MGIDGEQAIRNRGIAEKLAGLLGPKKLDKFLRHRQIADYSLAIGRADHPEDALWEYRCLAMTDNLELPSGFGVPFFTLSISTPTNPNYLLVRGEKTQPRMQEGIVEDDGSHYLFSVQGQALRFKVVYEFEEGFSDESPILNAEDPGQSIVDPLDNPVLTIRATSATGFEGLTEKDYTKVELVLNMVDKGDFGEK